MPNYYFELQSVDDLITVYRGTTLPVSQTAHDFASSKAFAWLENDTEETYPDLCVTDANAPTAVINSVLVTAQIIAGSHPPSRPK